MTFFLFQKGGAPAATCCTLKKISTQNFFVVNQKKIRGGYFGDGAFKIRHFRGFFGDPGGQGVTTHDLKSEKTAFFGLQKKSLFG